MTGAPTTPTATEEEYWSQAAYESDYGDHVSHEKAEVEIVRHIDEAVFSIVEQAACTVGDAKNALCAIFKNPISAKAHRYETENTFSDSEKIAFIAASYHSSKAKLDYLLGRKEDAIQHWLIHKFLLFTNFGERESIQSKGGKARHAKTREIKGILMRRWEEDTSKRTKRGFARAILPEVIEAAKKIGHTFPDDHAALDFIAKNLPKKRPE